MERQFSYNGATLTASSGTIRDRIQLSVVLRKLDVDDDDDFGSVAAFTFARFLTRVLIEGDIGLVVPAVTDAPEVIQAALEAFLDADGGLYDVVVEALNAVDEPSGDPDTQPKKKPE